MRARFLMLLLLVPALAAADTYPRQTGIDAVHYAFRLNLTDASDEITGEATITIKFVVDGVPEVTLDLASVVADTGMTVQSVRRGGPMDIPGPASDALMFTHTSDRLRVVLPPLVARAGQEFTFTVRYRGIPGVGFRIGNNMYGERTFISNDWPNRARMWLPMIDHPYDKATGEFIVTAPSQYQVVSNGALVEEVDLPDHQRRTHWKQSVPLASWLYSLAVGRYASHHAGNVAGIPLQTWVFPQDRETGIRIFEEPSRRALQFFSNTVGPYSYEKLANVEATGFGGGTEYASAIFFGEKNVSSGKAPVVHEIAHQWFGNSVTERDWDDVWLSEGFATYFALLFTEHDEGRDAFVAELARNRTQVIQLEQKLPDTPVIHRNLSDMAKVLNNLVYLKGGWFLHMLRTEVGTDTFWKGIREYYRRYQNGNASTAELRAVFERESGQTLDWLFDQWLARPGVPKLEGSWRYDPVKRAVEVTVNQSQAAAPYRLTVGVGIAGVPGSQPKMVTMELTGRQGVQSISVDAPPSAVTLDPSTALLADFGAFVRR